MSSIAETERSRSFTDTLDARGIDLRRVTPKVLQLNVGKLCNLRCEHCHVNAGPGRKEIMTRETIDRIVDWLAETDIGTVDLTGGAPEIIPEFRYLVERIRALDMPRRIIDRCNLTILELPEFEWLAPLLAAEQVEVVASMPCYSPGNVDAQRGDGVFDDSIAGLKRLNALGYGTRAALPLNLVYNPLGADLPPDQKELESDYKEALSASFGIVFNELYAIANMPIARFLSKLKRENRFESYMSLLMDSFNPSAVDSLMCRDTINIDWEGRVYDCDFNQMLGMPAADEGERFLWSTRYEDYCGTPIAVGDHCFGCTAGAGSSCGGALD